MAAATCGRRDVIDEYNQTREVRVETLRKRAVPGSHPTNRVVPGSHTPTAAITYRTTNSRPRVSIGTASLRDAWRGRVPTPARNVQLAARVARLLPSRSLLTTSQRGVITDARAAGPETS